VVALTVARAIPRQQEAGFETPRREPDHELGPIG
jgi:hypothetical protein